MLILEVLLLGLEGDVLHLGALVAQLWQAFQLPGGPLGEAWGRSGGAVGCCLLGLVFVLFLHTPANFDNNFFGKACSS